MNPWHPTPAESEQTTEEREYDEREMGEGDEVSENSVKHCKTPPSEGKTRLWPPDISATSCVAKTADGR